MAVGYVKFISMNRNTKKNFYKYMTLNPFYFKSIFPGMTIKKLGNMSIALKSIGMHFNHLNNEEIYGRNKDSFKDRI